jgi:hypothetical protein
LLARAVRPIDAHATLCYLGAHLNLLLNSGGVSRGMAAILTIKGGKGEWQQVKAGGAKPAKDRLR